MKYKVGDMVYCQVETRSSGKKAIFARYLDETIPAPTLENKSFEIITTICVNGIETYLILINDDMVGWTINGWHIIYQNVDPKFKGKKFYEVTEDFISRSKKKK